MNATASYADLLEALQAIESALDEFLSNDPTAISHVTNAWHIARTAIDKAVTV